MVHQRGLGDDLQKHEHPPSGTVPIFPDDHISQPPPEPTKIPGWNEDHGCHREGITSPFTGDWDLVENDNAGYWLLNPLVMAQMWLHNRTYTLAKEYMTEEQALEFYHYWRWTSDLQTDMEVTRCEIAALVLQNLPEKLTSLDEMLDTAMVESGFCCKTNIDAFLRSRVPNDRASGIARDIPDFKPEWLFIEGPNAPLERD